MPEWWSYSLSDFLLFSPRTYYRLIERHNLALWPSHLVALALGLGIAALLAGTTPWRSRAIMTILAILWAWVGWRFVAVRYATINWAAPYFAWLFAAEAALLLWLGLIAAKPRVRWRRDAAGLVGGALFAASVIAYPILAPAFGRGWTQSEVLGIAPDPTALGTVGLLLLAGDSPRARRALLVAPLVWCLLGGATLWVMHSPEAWILLLTAMLVPVISIAARRSTTRRDRTCGPRGGSLPAAEPRSG